MNLSFAQEDYLKSIWKLRESVKKASIKSVADMLSLRPSTVTLMFCYLEWLYLIMYDKSVGADLTDAGDELARKLIRKHRLMETFLETVLNLEGEILHREAEQLEHVVSDELMNYIDVYLDHPTIDPHGEEIPVLRSTTRYFTLQELPVGSSFEVFSMQLNDADTHYCRKNGIRVGSHWQISDRVPTGSALMISGEPGNVVLADEQARGINVSLITRKRENREVKI